MIFLANQHSSGIQITFKSQGKSETFFMAAKYNIERKRDRTRPPKITAAKVDTSEKEQT